MTCEDLDLRGVPVTALTFEALNLLSCLLDNTKILLSDGPDKLPRDWRGLASLINISSEIAGSYETRDKTARVIEYWVRKQDGTATVGKLLEYVQRIDRYDIFDDFMELHAQSRLVSQQPRNGVNPNGVVNLNGQSRLPNMQITRYEEDLEENIITFDDKICGGPQFYHAYVLYSYAPQDNAFVNEMLVKMRDRGYKLCTENDLLPDHKSTFAAVARLISSERCYRIILVYSPDFLESPANNFYMDYAQAVGIEMKKPKIIPCMFRECQLPPQMTFYHKLYYNTPGTKASYDFWDRLSCSLDGYNNNVSRINGLNSSSYSKLNITEIYSNPSMSNGPYMQNGLLALPSPPRSTSMSELDSIRTDSQSTSGESQKSKTKTGLNSLKKVILGRFTIKKKQSKVA